MRTFYKALILVSALALPLGLGAYAKSEGNPTIPTSVSLNINDQLITADEAKANEKGISILRTTAQNGYKVKQVSTFTSGSGGYNILLSNERLIQLYFVDTDSSTSKSSISNTTKNPIVAIDFGQKGKATITLLDKSKIELARTDETETTVFDSSQSVSPESQVLLSNFLIDKRELFRTHSKAKAIEVMQDGRLEAKFTYNNQGFLTTSDLLIYHDEGILKPMGSYNAVFTWAGERLINLELTERMIERESQEEDSHKVIFEYNQANQAFVKSFNGDGESRVLSIGYQPEERTVTMIENNMKYLLLYDEHYMLTKYICTVIEGPRNWVFEDNISYEYNEQGDITKRIEEFPKMDFLSKTREVDYSYEYDERGNWTKRIETTKWSGRPDISTTVFTRKIFY